MTPNRDPLAEAVDVFIRRTMGFDMSSRMLHEVEMLRAARAAHAPQDSAVVERLREAAELALQHLLWDISDEENGTMTEAPITAGTCVELLKRALSGTEETQGHPASEAPLVRRILAMKPDDFSHCPTCGSGLDTGWECNNDKCRKDWMWLAHPASRQSDG